MALMRTKEAYDYSTVDDRFLTHDGCIVDIGCAGWDMFASLVGKKRIIGVDPFEDEKEGYEFYKGVLSPVNGEVCISNNKDESSLMSVENWHCHIDSRTWKYFCEVEEIDQISILKLNIEGAEYPLLHSMDTDDFDKIDQIMVSFHDWINPKWRHLTFASVQLLLCNGYQLTHTASQYGWRLFVKG